MSNKPDHKNPHLQRHIQITEAQQELRNSRIHPSTKKKLNSKIGGLKKGMPGVKKSQ